MKNEIIPKVKTKLYHLIICTLFVCSITSCKTKVTKVERAFYYWKNNEYNLSDGEQQQLKTLQIQRLYVKFFEVEPDEIFGSKPFAKSQLHIWDYKTNSDSVLRNTMESLNIISTIFIKNSVFVNTTQGSLDTLAENIVFLINKYYSEKIKNSTSFYNEIQIDCDWTAKTKDNYFYLLKAIKHLSGKTISCTLRLYPFTYPDVMGVPPVDKATLMCYNLIGPFENEDKNSIQNNSELESYLRKADKYPLHIDIALPIFSWMQVYQNNQFAGIVNPNENDELQNALIPIKPLWYQLQQDIELDNIYLKEGDKVKLEEVTEKATMETIALLKKYLSLDQTTTITLFHLDERNLKKYTDETLANFYSDFSQ